MSKQMPKPKAAAAKAAQRPATKGKSTSRQVASVNVNKSTAPKQLSVMPAQTGGQRHFKQSKAEFDSEKANTNLKKASPWYSSYRDPIQGGGAKIPDTVGINTATLQAVQRVSVAVNAGGLAALEVISPYANLVGASGSNYKTSAPLSVSTGLIWNGAQALSAAASVRSIAQSHRIVSAAVYGEYEGTSLQDSGDCTAYLLSFGGNVLTTLSAIQSLYGSSVVPINKARSKPMVSRWFPISVNEQSYQDFFAPSFTAFGSGGCPNWTLGLIYNGLPASTGSVIFTIVVNYEFVPTLNSIDYISANPSPIDPFEEQLVEQWVQEDSQTGLSSNKMVDVQPGSQVTEAANQGMNAESGFGMLGGMIKEMLPELAPALLALL